MFVYMIVNLFCAYHIITYKTCTELCATVSQHPRQVLFLQLSHFEAIFYLFLKFNVS